MHYLSIKNIILLFSLFLLYLTQKTNFASGLFQTFLVSYKSSNDFAFKIQSEITFLRLYHLILIVLFLCFYGLTLPVCESLFVTMTRCLICGALTRLCSHCLSCSVSFTLSTFILIPQAVRPTLALSWKAHPFLTTGTKPEDPDCCEGFFSPSWSFKCIQAFKPYWSNPSVSKSWVCDRRRGLTTGQG